jgi:AraC-like DNA-binding protein
MLELMVGMSRDAVAPADKTLPLWLKQARDLLHAHFTENLSLEALASILSVHPAHLTHAFRQHYRTTIGDPVLPDP